MSKGTNNGAGVLVLNAGSSSLKFALFDAEHLSRKLAGKFARIGLPEGELTATHFPDNAEHHRKIPLPDHAACIVPLHEILKSEKVRAIGHRIVHGGPNFQEPQMVTPPLLAELRRFSPLDPEHLPAALGLIEAIGAAYVGVPQIACFDTAFHQTMPRVAKMLPLPRRYDAMGVRRYGFHGLSYAYLMQELEKEAGAEVANGCVILAHLGNGASMAAVRNGRSIDTSMSFTPTAGLVMSTRTGDLDPGLVMYFSRAEGMTANQFNELVNKRAGLLGVSEISPDVRDLLESKDSRANEALDLFCYQAKKFIGAYAAAMGGLDTLVFSGGIGENSPPIRARICEGLEFLGIELDDALNQANQPILSKKGGKAVVRMIRTDEELMIARFVRQVLVKHQHGGE